MQIGHRQRPAGDDLVGGPQGRFHHAAGVGEDVGGTAGKPQGGIHLFVGQAVEIDARGVDHLAQLARGEHHVNVADAAGGHLGPLAFVLLRRARHDGNDEHILGPLVQFIGVIRLGQGPEHLLRRLATGKVRQQVGMEVLEEIDPARRTTGEHRQGNV